MVGSPSSSPGLAVLGTTGLGFFALLIWVLAVSVHSFPIQKERSDDNPIAPVADKG
jgi:hypothetical protein